MFFKKKRIAKDKKDKSVTSILKTEEKSDIKNWEEMDDIEFSSQNRIETNRALSKEMENLREFLKISSP